jgi:hypothetical protein
MAEDCDETNVDSLANLADIPEGLDIDIEMAPSRQDVRHRFTLSAIGQAPGAVRVSGLLTLESEGHQHSVGQPGLPEHAAAREPRLRHAARRLQCVSDAGWGQDKVLRGV